jgi:hypothetical protein
VLPFKARAAWGQHDTCTGASLICSNQHTSKLHSRQRGPTATEPSPQEQLLTCKFGKQELRRPVAVEVCCQVQCTRASGRCAACCTHGASIHLLITFTMHLQVQTHRAAGDGADSCVSPLQGRTAEASELASHSMPNVA